MKKKLFYFVPLNFEMCFRKGNISYLRCYEYYFDRNYIIYFNSEKDEVKRIERTIYIGVGGSKYIYVNILKSPLVLLKLYKRILPNVCITTDWLYSFWSALFLRRKQKFFFFPICFVGQLLERSTPNDMRYKFLENLSIRLSLRFSQCICVVPSQIKYDPFWETNTLTKNKLIHLSQTVEEYPTIEFLQKVSLPCPIPIAYQDRISLKLVTTSRLYAEKLLDEAIQAIQMIVAQGIKVDFYIFGEGAERQSLEALTISLGIKDSVHFMGAAPNEELVPFLQYADIYLSTLTGTAMREAILADLPVVTYKNIMTQMYFDEYGSIGYITPTNTPEALAEGIIWYIKNKDKHSDIKENVRKLKQRWSPDRLKEALSATFDPYLKESA
jgi:glycosyltransferase involved in cell wall biosynthesis